MRKIEGWLLDELVSHCEDQRYASVETHLPGEKIFAKGDAGDYMAVLLSGVVDIKRDDHILMTFEYGSIFGEMGLIDHEPRSADAFARTQSRIARIREAQFNSLLTKNPHFALAMMRILTDRLRNSIKS